MARSLSLVLTFFTCLLAAPAAPLAASPLVATGPEIGLSEPLWVAAPGGRGPVAAAAGNEVGLVLWSDGRTGNGSQYLVASRVSAGGESLDPRGIPLGLLGPAGVVWNGDAFAVTAGPWFRGHEITFIGEDGTVSGPQPIDLPSSYALAAVSQPGAEPRFLFLTWSHGDNFVETKIAVVDGQGRVVDRDVVLPRTPGLIDQWRVAGSGDDGFLILRSGLDHMMADRISADGEILSSKHAGFVIPHDSISLAGNAAGWVVANSEYPSSTATWIQLLNDDGTLRSGPHAFPAALPQPSSVPRIQRLAGDIVMSWYSGTNRQSFVTTVGADGEIHGAMPIVSGARPLLIRVGDQHLAFFDSRAMRLGSSFEQGEISLLAMSATTQKSVALAEGGNGFLAGWIEEGRGTFVRRMSRSGSPQDPQPIEVGSDLRGQIAIASSGDVYVVVVVAAIGTAGVDIRRLDASTGLWIDPAPVRLAEGGAALAFNGRDVIMAWSVRCDPGSESCLRALTIPVIGPLIPSPAVTLYRLEWRTISGVAIASSGTESLVTWTEYQPCYILCPPSLTPVRALRLRHDATAIDAQPLLLQDLTSGTSWTSVAWDGRAYVVAWSVWTGRTPDIRAMRVTREGAVLEGEDPAGTLIGMPGDQGQIVGRLIAMESGVAFVTRTTAWASSPPPPSSVIQMVSISRDTPLSDVAAAPRTVVAHLPEWAGTGIAAAANGDRVMVGYDRLDVAAGFVPRAFVRTIGEPAARRRAIAR